jgi:large subunit ribosomal protein L25
LETDVTPTIKGRDFVIATLAAPTVMKEPEKPAEAEAAEGDTEAAADGDKPEAEGEKKEGDDKKAAEEKK